MRMYAFRLLGRGTWGEENDEPAEWVGESSPPPPLNPSIDLTVQLSDVGYECVHPPMHAQHALTRLPQAVCKSMYRRNAKYMG